MSELQSPAEEAVHLQPVNNGARIDELLGDRQALKGRAFGGVDVRISRRVNGVVQVYVPRPGKLPFRFDLRGGVIVSAYDPHGLAREFNFYDGPERCLQLLLHDFVVDEAESDALNRAVIASSGSRPVEAQVINSGVREKLRNNVPGLGESGFDYRNCAHDHGHDGLY